MNIKQIIMLIALLFQSIIIKSLPAQIKNSPYSMFGVGQIIDNSYGINKSLGGTGIAFQSDRSINYLNPASYLGIRSNSFDIELGIYGIYSTSMTEKSSQSDGDVNFSYFSANYFWRTNG